MNDSIPKLDGQVRLSGPEGIIEIYRDNHGIPHVYANSENDAFFGQGFATAQDRLWHMEADRKRAYGEWSELIGTSGLDQDRLFRSFRIKDLALSSLKTTSTEALAMLKSYTAGINSFIDSSSKLPIEFSIIESEPEQWNIYDCIAVYAVRHIMMGVFEGKVWRARLFQELGYDRACSLIKGYQSGHSIILPPGGQYQGNELPMPQNLTEFLNGTGWLADVGTGSNNWVLSGEKTASGKPLLAGDPHRPIDTPNVYYQNHIRCPNFDVIGLSFPGSPGFPHFGHNSRVAWCVTHAQADYQDLYVERFHPTDTSKYLYDEKWQDADIRTEKINIKGESSIEITTRATRHGPIVMGNPENGEALSFKYTAAEPGSSGFNSIYSMLQAKSTHEIDNSMKDWVDPCNNFLFADVDGSTGYLLRGKIPKRSEINGWIPVPGSTDDHEWSGYIPFNELPRIHDPKSGYIVTANNQIVDESYPHHIGFWFAPEYRAARITKRLESLNKATVADMSAIHGDDLSIPATIFTKYLPQIEASNEKFLWAKELLIDWNNSMDTESIAPTIYSMFRIQLHEKVFSHLLGKLYNAATESSGRGAPVHLMQLGTRLVTAADHNETTMLPPGHTWVTITKVCLELSVLALTNIFGPNTSNWQWGKVHKTKPHHVLSNIYPQLAEILDPPSVPLGGDGDTPMAAGFSETEPFTITGSSAARYVFDLSDWNNSRWIVPLGSSGNPGSPHYSDQSKQWAKLELNEMLYDWDKIKSNYHSLQSIITDK